MGDVYPTSKSAKAEGRCRVAGALWVRKGKSGNCIQGNEDLSRERGNQENSYTVDWGLEKQWLGSTPSNMRSRSGILYDLEQRCRENKVDEIQKGDT